MHDAQTQQWLWFHEPVQLHVASDIESVSTVLETVEREAHAHHLYAAGFVAYEAAPAFDSAFVTKPAGNFPLVWFGLYRQPEIITLPAITDAVIPEFSWQRSISEADYRSALDHVKECIRRGETYQVNYSFRLQAPAAFGSATSTDLTPWAFFLHMIRAQGSGYGAFVQTEGWAIASASPELFFQRTGRELISKPMKGTAPRGLWFEDDQAQAEGLRHSEKNQAENLMIVDMVRNDMGQIADIGSVTVPHLFEVEQYPTLWQMTSTVRCTTDASLTEIFRALFPAASITGAPKARTMQIIAELETSPRHIYTGTIGYIRPNGDAQFNVAIRTVLSDRPQPPQLPHAEYGVGGGIVWDSEKASEFQECFTKARILTHCPPDFDLLESLLWTPQDGYFLLEQHLQRLLKSARYFGRHVDIAQLHQDCAAFVKTMLPQPHKVRLQVQQSGEILLQAQPLEPFNTPYSLPLARYPVNPNHPFLYHKTTYRQVYQQAIAAARAQDVLLWNDRHELTESCIANLVVEWDGQLVTPPLSCGLLPGVYRSYLLEQGKIVERVVRVEDLPKCSRVFLINSVRGLWEVDLEPWKKAL
nr:MULTISPECIES: aminodeoxychorismate synthase component I [unclassified Leptolyngbya]